MCSTNIFLHKFRSLIISYQITLYISMLSCIWNDWNDSFRVAACFAQAVALFRYSKNLQKSLCTLWHYQNIVPKPFPKNKKRFGNQYDCIEHRFQRCRDRFLVNRLIQVNRILSVVQQISRRKRQIMWWKRPREDFLCEAVRHQIRQPFCTQHRWQSHRRLQAKRARHRGLFSKRKHLHLRQQRRAAHHDNVLSC